VTPEEREREREKERGREGSGDGSDGGAAVREGVGDRKRSRRGGIWNEKQKLEYIFVPTDSDEKQGKLG
jgi:hypothetical protein